MVEYWCDDESTLALAQAALAEGVSNCGLNSLASYLNPDKPESVLRGGAMLDWSGSLKTKASSTLSRFFPSGGRWAGRLEWAGMIAMNQ